MKINLIFRLLLLTLYCCLNSCSSENITDCYSSINSINNQLYEHVLLKDIYQKGDLLCFKYEDDTILEIPSSHISDYAKNDTLWVTHVTMSDGTTLKIPTLGKNIDSFATSVKVNSSTYNPLSAEVVFNLPEQGRLKLIVHTKQGNKEPDITYTFKSIEKSQTIPVLGLYANYDNHVTFIYTDLKGNERARSEVTIKTVLPSSIYLPKAINVTTLDNSKYEDGMTMVNSWGESLDDTSVPYMIDRDGEIRWVLDWDKHPDLKFIRIDCGLVRSVNGHFMSGDGNNNNLVEVDCLGNLINKWDLGALGYNFHHAISETADKHIMLCVTRIDAKIAGGGNSRENDHVIEFEPSKGEILQKYDFAMMLDTARHQLTGAADPRYPMSQNASNWLHNNGILKIGNEYLATGRYQGIFRFTKLGGVKWIISGHEQWRKSYRKILLQPLHKDGTPITDPEVISGRKACEDFDWPWGVHCCVQLPNGHYMAYDNGYGRHYQKISPSFVPYSRAVEYEVDEKNMTVRQIWQYGQDRGRAFFSPMASSVEYLPKTGNRLIGCADYNIMSDGNQGARICEVDPSTNKVVFEAELVNGNFHRVGRMSLYPEGL